MLHHSVLFLIIFTGNIASDFIVSEIRQAQLVNNTSTFSLVASELLTWYSKLMRLLHLNLFVNDIGYIVVLSAVTGTHILCVLIYY